MRNAILLPLAFVALVSAQDSPDARTILESVTQSMPAGSSYRVEMQGQFEASNQKVAYSGYMLVQQPDRMRAELHFGPMQMQIVNDGQQTWMYMPMMKQYSKTSTGKGMLPAGMESVVMGGADLMAGLKSAERIADATVTFDGQPVVCFVVVAKYGIGQRTSTLWIDKSQRIVLRRREEMTGGSMNTVIDFEITKFVWNPPIAENDFTFTPPEGATELQDLATRSISADMKPQPAPSPQATTPPPIQVGAGFQTAKLIRKVAASYPEKARNRRIQGTVSFTAIIGKNGAVKNLELKSGHPLLVSSAREAVLQWLYRPTLLNGQPVEVITRIDVHFTLTE